MLKKKLLRYYDFKYAPLKCIEKRPLAAEIIHFDDSWLPTGEIENFENTTTQLYKSRWKNRVQGPVAQKTLR